jgi:hypothetical protein
MVKELKYLFYIFIISLFIYFSLKYYLSDDYKKKSFRLLKLNNEKVYNYSKNLILLSNNTNNIVKYVEKTFDENKKNYNFWKLINND